MSEFEMIHNKTPQKKKLGFTLVELLVAITIIGIMASMVMFALMSATTDAKVARTRGTVQKINEVVLARWEEYRYKPVPVQMDPALIAPLPSGVYPVAPRESARVRMIVLRDMMRMEMPDRISDLIYSPTQYTVEYTDMSSGSPVPSATKIRRAIPPGFGILYNSLRNQVHSLALRKVVPPTGRPWEHFGLASLPDHYDKFDPVTFLSSNPPAPLPPPPSVVTLADWNVRIQSSELLYLLVSTCNYGGSSALEYFRNTEVGDTDEDGMLEFIDGWGRSISWIRWPAGYPGDLVRYADNDAMDPIKTDWRYRNESTPIPPDWQPRTLVPLVLSAGPDGDYGVTFDFTTPIAYATMQWTNTPPNVRGVGGHMHMSLTPYYYPDPFFTFDYSSSVPNGPSSTIPAPDSDPQGYRYNQLGSVPTVGKPFAADNITNHDLILEP
jgi:prepilin-type N-terminal cleavage/methylation domain-containing protein